MVNSLTAEPATWVNVQQIWLYYNIISIEIKIRNKFMIMTLFILKSWPNHVPAAAVTRGRQVLFMFNRFKRYVDSKLSLKKGLIN